MISNNLREVLINEKKQLMLSIMDEIDDFCRINHLTYFLVGGTLLGAVRHQGFIPWDDDMDIGLPRRDYQVLISNFKSESGNVQINDYHSSKHYKWASAKAYDKRTILIELGDEVNTTGVFVDVFPFDAIQGNKKIAMKETKKKKLWKDVLALKHLKIDKRRSILKNIIIIFGKLLYVIPDRYIIQKINSSEKCPIDFKDCAYVCNFTGAWGIRELTSSKNFLSTIDADFEGRKYKIPVGYDDYLKTVYGDYMTPPPKEKQVSHHSSVAYWKE